MKEVKEEEKKIVEWWWEHIKCGEAQAQEKET